MCDQEGLGGVGYRGLVSDPHDRPPQSADSSSDLAPQGYPSAPTGPGRAAAQGRRPGLLVTVLAGLLAGVIGGELAAWRAREEGDLGVMLLEMWAYICDDLSFYDELIALAREVRDRVAERF